MLTTQTSAVALDLLENGIGHDERNSWRAYLVCFASKADIAAVAFSKTRSLTAIAVRPPGAYRCWPGAAFNAMFVTSNSKWLGLIGRVLLITALVGWCPAYGALGVNTCPNENLR
jgi:hypothetical protein